MAKIAKLRNQATELFQKGKYDKALPLLQKIIAADPRDTISRQRIVDCYERLGKKNEAVDVLLQLARFFIEDGRSTHAQATLRRALRINPNNVEALEKLSDLLIAQNNLVEARNILNQLAEAYRKQNRLTKVLDVLNRMLQIDPNNIPLKHRRASIKAELGRKEEAAQEYAEIVHQLVKAGQFEDAVNVGEKALKHFAHNVEIIDALAVAYAHLGQASRVAEMLEAVPNKTAQHWIMLGRAYAELERMDDAMGMLVEAVRLEPNNHQVYENLLSVAPPDRWEDVRPWVHSYVRKAFSEGDSENGWKILSQALEKQPTDEFLLHTAVDYLKRHQQITKILEILDRALSRSLEENQPTLAFRILDEILAIDPDNEQYREKKAYIEKLLEEGGGLPAEALDASAKPAPAPVPEPEPQEMEEAFPGGVEDEEELREYIGEQITEAEVFYRYGMVQKAIEELERVIQQYPLVPFSEPAYVKLYKLYLNEGHHDRAVDKLFQLVNFHFQHNNPARIPPLLEEIREIRPRDARLNEWETRLAQLEEGVSTPSGEMVEVSSEIEGILEEIEKKDEITPEFQMELQEIRFYIQNGLFEDADRLLNKWLKRFPDHPEVQHLKEQVVAGLREQEGEAGPVAERAPVPVEAEAEEEEEIELELDLSLEESAPMVLEEEAEPIEASLSAEVARESTPEMQPDLMETIMQSGAQEAVQEEVTAREAQEAEGPVELDFSSPERTAVKPEQTPAEPEAEKPAAKKSGRKFEEIEASLDEMLAQLKIGRDESKSRARQKMQEEAETEVIQEVISEFKETVTHGKGDEEPEEEFQLLDESLAGTVAETIAQIEQEGEAGREKAEPEPVQSTMELATDFMDLAQEFEQELLQLEETETPVVEDPLQSTLQQFKQKIEEVVPEEDARTHFDLGLAYLQMGLLDEAIVEFQKAARNDDFFVDAQIQLADCFVQKGLPDAAVKSYVRILERPNLEDSLRKEAQYQLAMLLEELGELERAYEIYLEIFSLDAGYKDVKHRIEQLESLRRQKPH